MNEGGMTVDIRAILSAAAEAGASDIHLKVGAPPMLRVRSRLAPLQGMACIDRETMQAYLAQLMADQHRERLARNLQVDFGYGDPVLGRFRINVFLQRGEPSIAMRLVPAAIRSVEELRLPAITERIAEERRGLVLVTGTTGSGKSTTLAAMVRTINESRACHIITVEDPIEYAHGDVRSIISQREIGADATTFAEALKAALRQDPDVILVGEMRDLETIETALLAAETGHLVMSTLHTLDAPETVTRVISAFPEHQRDQARIILANVLKGIISQRLVPRSDGAGVVPAVEVMVSTALVRDCIAIKERTREIREAIARGHQTYGMQTFDQSLMQLWRQGLITYEEALVQTSNPDDFALEARGVTSTSDSRWSDFSSAEDDGEGEATEAVKVERF
jgi:twitching motility protein PilT